MENLCCLCLNKENEKFGHIYLRQYFSDVCYSSDGPKLWCHCDWLLHNYGINQSIPAQYILHKICPKQNR